MYTYHFLFIIANSLLSMRYICQGQQSFCTCNLIVASCDINCCCDPDCDGSDRQVFSRCSNEPAISSRYCLQQDLVFINNTQLPIERRSDNVFCIDKDNNAAKLQYKIPDPILDERTFLDYKTSFGKDIPVSIGQSFVLPKSRNATYQVDQLVYGVNSQNFVVPFPSPGPQVSNICNYRRPASFFRHEQNSCVVRVSDIANSCTTLPYLSAGNFLSIKLLQNPITGSTADNFSHLIVPINIGQVNYLDSISNTIRRLNVTTLPQPSWNNGQLKCDNAVKMVALELLVNGSLGILNATAEITLTDLQQNNSLLEQTFGIRYRWVDEPRDLLVRPGNPGYIRGEPIMAGMLVQNGTAFAIELNVSRSEWLTVIASGPGGKCTNAQRINVLFGQNLESGCLIEVLPAMSLAQCANVQQQIIDLLEGESLKNRIATYGNSTVNISGDWVPVLFENKPTVPTLDPQGAPSASATGPCTNLVFGVVIEILFANTGAYENPQAKIVGVKYKYNLPQDLLFFCPGIMCVAQLLPVTSKVFFIDVSQPPVAVMGKIPTVDVKLPNDFFYPFYGNHVPYVNTASVLLLLSCILVQFGCTLCEDI